MKIVVTGGAGYIGSHTCISLLEKGYEVVIVDNLCNSKKVAVDRIEQLSGKKVVFYEYDVCDVEKMREVFSKEKADAVIHFAGLKAVGESVSIPLDYYDNNLVSTFSLLKAMREYGVHNFVFSSSATVYGDPESVPVKEDAKLSAMSPYGATKLMIERILTDCEASYEDLNVVLLRYFNPVGAHESGMIGEDPKGIPNNLVPYISQVAIGKLEKLSVFGNDYPTDDGTCVRDYIHVTDLAEGHVAAIKLFEKGDCGLKIFNLGTEVGYSVLDILNTFIKVTGVDIPYQIVGRRAGDVPINYADCTKAHEELSWKAEKNLEDMLRDVWRWQQKNPNGFE